ncbi:MAG TPA: PSD1 and planctomycete cytochrome C domain-containing protein [Gemmataceae bacterium]|nr:PSD1 and planctomycete cytochrome C domain-containing protein [Gemmataceae bacterium]
MLGIAWKKLTDFQPGWTSLLLVALAVSAAPPALRAAEPNPQGAEFFERNIRPILVETCHKCHGGEKHKGNLDLTSRAGMLKGGDSGPAIVPGRPEQSLLIKALGYTDDVLRMPPKSKLANNRIADFTTWVKMGAPWPEAVAASRAGPGKAFNLQERKKHWCWQPLKTTVAPDVKHAAWPRSPIDRFVLAKLEANGLAPAKPADKRTLIRRVTYDLIGLPPTPWEIEAFLADTSPRAFARVVERLLESPHYGERWGRHWLDLARYAETYGHEFDFEISEASAYRDYVIRAFNADVPYDQFVLEQVAGDLFPAPRRHPVEGFNESIIGTGFWFLGEAAHSPVDVRAYEMDQIDNQIDVFAKAFLGLTVSCARCHDHKFDAISTRDYYALSGYLQSSRLQRAFIDPPASLRKTIAELSALSEQASRLAVPPAQTAAVTYPQQGGTVFEDFAKGTYDDWFVTGEAFGKGPTRAPEVLLSDDPHAPVRQVVAPGVAHSGLLSGKLQGALRSKSFAISRKKILYHAAGSESQINLIIDGYQLIREPIYGGLTIKLSHDKPRWYTQDVSMWIGHRAYIELLDDGPGYLAIDRILLADEPPPAGFADAEPSPGTCENTDRLAALVDRRKLLERNLPPPRRALALIDGTAWNDHVHIRGNPNQFGEAVPRRFLEAIAGNDQPCPGSGSGRLQLARRMIDSSDGLLPRVMVNRIWQHHFGAGIVRSPDNFGALGETPTHPELLDYLAAEFVRHGWSIKNMHRLMLLSSSYQMASRANESTEARDPQNKLLHGMPIQRLEAECIRDAILAVSGSLDARPFGKSVPPYLTPHMAGRGRPTESGPLDGAGRRSIYLNVRRNFLTPMFLAFDYPIPFTAMGRRSVSNVPAQALALMNNPFVVQQAEKWARRVLADKGKSARQRVADLYVTAFGRPPDDNELAEAMAFLQNPAAPAERDNLEAWRDLCHVLFNVKEFIFIN